MLSVLLADDDDSHVAPVADRLTKRRLQTIRLGVGANFGLVSSRVAPQGLAALSLDGTRFAAEEIVSVWDRARSSTPIVTNESWQYVYRERKAFLESLAAVAPQARWMNPLAASAKASNKLAQLVAARRAGFLIPDTCITNDIEELTRFCGEAGNVVFKALTFLATMDGHVLFTNEIDADTAAELGYALRAAPCIFQKKVAKRYELRVTCVGDHAFAARIESQAHPATKLDWRRDQENVEYRAYRLPGHVEEAVLEVMTELGLAFGAFDLARTSNGDYVFFEVNPSGNWLWLEETLNLPIADAIAAWLAGPARSPGATLAGLARAPR